uniref:calcium/calmodulin-dependent 3',5'-cyclic nucleotide phosphodiesterase 1C-like isoform X1 n=1 Tax=Gasterosteus aculeatus aculeatus TaxID=481459 RepID=UPI001A97FA47|nr:calcium/calmodulin-dependent 3',5'-cyclic nucleotide phosphodiesterase 1C-like isoform X1 [Gasterosteus aculeatus aculeatus]XP_040025499.1 calcium/calmodulin-dependent 3',5'-cyclic nucleotide phosphodiesterase 1C-like isoform X1 [Gasterosteus aculeatus aculeatus]
MSCRSLVPRTPWRRLPAGCLVKQLERVEASVVELKRNLDYAASVLEALCIEEARRLVDPEDQLGDIRSDSVPSEVRDWLASTFTRQTAVMLRRNEDKPRFRSIVHAVQAGIFVERGKSRSNQLKGRGSFFSADEQEGIMNAPYRTRSLNMCV